MTLRHPIKYWLDVTSGTPAKKPDPDVLHQQIVRELRVREWIRHNEDVGLQTCVGRKRSLSRNLIELKTDFCFEPYLFVIYKSDLAHGGIADERSQS